MTAHTAAALDAKELGRLRWRARRGLLENDLVMARFFAKHSATLTPQDANGLTILLELSDNELMDLILQRTELDASAHTDTVQVLHALRSV